MDLSSFVSFGEGNYGLPHAVIAGNCVETGQRDPDFLCSTLTPSQNLIERQNCHHGIFRQCKSTASRRGTVW